MPLNVAGFLPKVTEKGAPETIEINIFVSRHHFLISKKLSQDKNPAPETLFTQRECISIGYLSYSQFL